MQRLKGIIRLVIALTMMASLPASSQEAGFVQSDILLLDPDRLFTQTRLGQRINRDYLAEREKLIAKNDKIAAELEAEELALTKKRAGMTPDEFRELADDFDVRVQEIRRESERAVRELERSRDRAPVTFMRMVEPVLVQLMRESGGAVILDVRSVLLRADVVDITNVAIRRVDAEIGDGLSKPQNDAAQETEAEN